jgi:hypothetical protein
MRPLMLPRPDQQPDSLSGPATGHSWESACALELSRSERRRDPGAGSANQWVPRHLRTSASAFLDEATGSRLRSRPAAPSYGRVLRPRQTCCMRLIMRSRLATSCGKGPGAALAAFRQIEAKGGLVLVPAAERLPRWLHSLTRQSLAGEYGPMMLWMAPPLAPACRRKTMISTQAE